MCQFERTRGRHPDLNMDGFNKIRGGGTKWHHLVQMCNDKAHMGGCLRLEKKFMLFSFIAGLKKKKNDLSKH